MKKNYHFAALFGAFLCVAPTSCSNENEEIDENPAAEVVFDNKGDDSSDEEIILSPNKDKKGLKGGETVLSYDIKMLHSTSNNLPASKYMDGGMYYKLNIDFNAGAGGEWIYLYYRNTWSVEEAVTNMVGTAFTSSKTEAGLRDFMKKYYNGAWYPARDENQNPVNLNAGSGGKYQYLEISKDPMYTPITSFYVVSTKKDYMYVKSKKFDGDPRTYYPVVSVSNILNNDRRNLLGLALDFNTDTKKHDKAVYIYYTKQ